MPTPGDYSNEIARLERLLNSGIVSGTTDGRTAEFDPQAIRQRLSELRQAQEAAGFGDGSYRPRNATIDLTGA